MMCKKTFIICIVSIVLVGIAPFVGKTALSVPDIINFRGGDAEIFWRIRIPRTLMAFLAGAVLSLSGMVFQAIFRNPLATPYTLGVASGASLGTALFFMMGSYIALPSSGVSVASFLGAISAVMLVYGMGRILGNSTSSVLLVGIALNFSFSSIIMFIQYTADFISSHRIIRFMIGGLDSAGITTVVSLLPVVLIGFMVIALYSKELDLISTGEDVAISRGVNVARMKYVLYFNVSLILGLVVSVSGPIGFVGMMAPHICRLLVGTSHRMLMPASLFLGGAFLTVCDTFARIIIYPAEIPVGVVTSMLGGPFFIFLLLKSRKKIII